MGTKPGTTISKGGGEEAQRSSTKYMNDSKGYRAAKYQRKNNHNTA